VILPHGVLFRGNAEARIRENLLKQGYIKGIIGLPANLFYGTGIPACIIVIDKEDAQLRAFNANGESQQGIFMIDASKGFIKDGNKNRLRAQDIHKIVDAFNREQEIPASVAWSRCQKLRPTTSTSISLAISTAAIRKICTTFLVIWLVAFPIAILMLSVLTGKFSRLYDRICSNLPAWLQQCPSRGR
jgi:type I restriction-modification system DNA methylase subunit